jgi:hypothetical protein
MLVRGLTLTLFSSNSGYKQTTTLYIETKIEERERRDEREEKNEKERGSGRHVSPLPNNTFILSTEGRVIRKKLKPVCLCQVRGQGSKVNFK